VEYLQAILHGQAADILQRDGYKLCIRQWKEGPESERHLNEETLDRDITRSPTRNCETSRSRREEGSAGFNTLKRCNNSLFAEG
jgi:hypothetical protein